MPLENRPSNHLIINTDPGCDDAVAILAATAAASGQFTEIDSVAIYGNDSTKQTGKNLVTLGTIIDELRQSDASFPEQSYYSGAEQALRKKRPYTGNADFIMGENGMGGVQQTPTRTLELSGVIYDRLAANPNATAHVVSLGAVTELAKMMTRPDMEGKVKSVTVMGGTMFEEGNFSMHVEWNLSNDPKALEIVLRSCDSQGIPFTLVPLDLTQKPEIGLTQDRFEWLYRELQGRGSHSMAEIIKTLVGPDSTYYKFFTSSDNTKANRKSPYNRIVFEGAAIHDLTAQLVQLDSGNFEIYPMQVMVDKTGAIGTARDYMATEDFRLHTIQVATDVINSEQYWQKVVDSLSQYR